MSPDAFGLLSQASAAFAVACDVAEDDDAALDGDAVSPAALLAAQLLRSRVAASAAPANVQKDRDRPLRPPRLMAADSTPLPRARETVGAEQWLPR